MTGNAPSLGGALGLSARPTRATVISFVVLEVLLWLVIAGIAVRQIVAPLVGQGFLGLGNGPVFGAPLTVDATLTDEAAASGTAPTVLPGELVGGPFPRGEYVETSDPTGFTISVFQPMTFRQTAGLVGGEVLFGAVVVVALLLAVALVRDARGGALFESRNLYRLTHAGVLLAVGGTLAGVLHAWGRLGVLQADRVGGTAVLDWSVSLNPLMLGLVLVGAAAAIHRAAGERTLRRNQVSQTV